MIENQVINLTSTKESSKSRVCLCPILFSGYLDDFLHIPVNHILYADDLCIISLSPAGLQQLLVQCDEYCRKNISLSMQANQDVCFSNLVLTKNVILLICF